MNWRVIMQPEAKLELMYEAKTYGGRLVDEVDAVREWLSKMHLRYQQWNADPDYRRAVLSNFPFSVFYRIDDVRQTVSSLQSRRRARNPDTGAAGRRSAPSVRWSSPLRTTTSHVSGTARLSDLLLSATLHR